MSATVETERLIVRDISGDTPPEMFQRLAGKADSTLTEVLRFWSADPRVNQFGKIIVELDPLDRKASYSFFFFRREGGQRVRVVKVSGGGEHPHHLAHKLTSAVFPNPDKLIRNMMGEASELRFGNPLSFPACGFDKDYWVAALLQENLHIPLTKIGTEHADWGMEIQNNQPRVKDRARQHASYIEAGSFGEFLITRYGVEKMKQFNLQSRSKPRPWEDVFGLPLEQMEANWLEAVRTKSRGKEEEIATLVKLLKDNPNTACSSAQGLAGGQ